MRSLGVLLAALLWVGAVAAPVHAQSSDRGSGNVYGPYSVYGPGLTYKQTSKYYGPYSVYGPGLTGRGASFTTVPTFTTVRASTSVTVPDGGEALVAGYSRVSEGRNEFGVPGVGKVPYLDRGFRNVGAGRDVRRTTLSVRVRIINLAEEEERQTGVRP
jgi:Flp pilus assembly secretin CpaC